MAAPTGMVYISGENQLAPNIYAAGIAGGKGHVVSYDEDTLIALMAPELTNVEVWYSTDDGASWTQCTTTLGFVADNNAALPLAMNHDDNYLAVPHDGDITFFTFDGSDITVEATISTIYSASDQASAVCYFENPLASTEWIYAFMINDSLGNLGVVGVRITKSTYASPGDDTISLTAAGDFGASLAWETTEANGPFGANNDRVWAAWNEGSGGRFFSRLTWDTGNVWASSAGTAWTRSNTNDMVRGFFYSETEGELLLFVQNGTTNDIEVQSITPAGYAGSWTARTDSSALEGSTESRWGMGWSGILNKAVVHGTDLSTNHEYQVYDAAADSWDTLQQVALGGNTEGAQLNGLVLDGLTTGRLAWVVRSDVDHLKGAVAFEMLEVSAAASFVGWGIPMGIA